MKFPTDSGRLVAGGVRLISILWAASWISYGVASGISQGLAFVRILFNLAISGLFFTLLQLMGPSVTCLEPFFAFTQIKQPRMTRQKQKSLARIR